MRLLHAQTFHLRSFDENTTPPYAILSHTWGEDEVSFQDIQGPNAASKAGFQKIRYVCEHAVAKGLYYVWVDTCCIDKTSSAELSEAINSMFLWYKNAEYCYAYLADVPDGTDIESISSTFTTSRWFTRGWTLQELLGPKDLKFFSSGGQELGTKLDLKKQVSKITSIDEGYLIGNDLLPQASIAKRMSWASSRTTTRSEDIAYCLLGIFGINMPLLYGEGGKSFIRLQEEIMRTSDDQSLFAWGFHIPTLPASQISHDHHMRPYDGPFASHPASFKDSGHIVPDELEPTTEAFTLTNKGLQVNIRVNDVLSRFLHPVAILACRPEQKLLWLIGISLLFLSDDSFTRHPVGGLCLVRRDELLETPYRSLRFITPRDHLPILPIDSVDNNACIIRKVPGHYRSGGLSIWNVEPREAWDPEQRIISLTKGDERQVVLRLWRRRGEGYAVVLEHVLPPYDWDKTRRWQYCVFRETCDEPRSYDFYSRSKRSLSPEYEHILSPDIRINKGNYVTAQSGVSFQIIDIELAKEASAVVDDLRYSGGGSIGPQPVTEMLRWTSAFVDGVRVRTFD